MSGSPVRSWGIVLVLAASCCISGCAASSPAPSSSSATKTTPAPPGVKVALQKVERQPAPVIRVSERMAQHGPFHTAAAGFRYVDVTLAVSGPSVSATSDPPIGVPWVEAAGKRYDSMDVAYTGTESERYEWQVVREFEIPEEATGAVMYVPWLSASAKPLTYRLF
jgi:hypothetical protein